MRVKASPNSPGSGVGDVILYETMRYDDTTIKSAAATSTGPPPLLWQPPPRAPNWRGTLQPEAEIDGRFALRVRREILP